MNINCTMKTSDEIRAWAQAYAKKHRLDAEDVLQSVASGLNGGNSGHGIENRIYDEFPERLKCLATIEAALSDWGEENGTTFGERLRDELKRLPRKE